MDGMGRRQNQIMQMIGDAIGPVRPFSDRGGEKPPKTVQASPQTHITQPFRFQIQCQKPRWGLSRNRRPGMGFPAIDQDGGGVCCGVQASLDGKSGIRSPDFQNDMQMMVHMDRQRRIHIHDADTAKGAKCGCDRVGHSSVLPVAICGQPSIPGAGHNASWDSSHMV